MIQTVPRRDIVYLNFTKLNPCKCSVTYWIIARHALVTLSQAECPHTTTVEDPCSPTWYKNVYYLVCIVYINWNFRLLPFVTTWPYEAPYHCFFKAAKTLCQQVNVQPSCGISVHKVPERKTVSNRNCYTAYQAGFVAFRTRVRWLDVHKSVRPWKNDQVKGFLKNRMAKPKGKSWTQYEILSIP